MRTYGDGSCVLLGWVMAQTKKTPAPLSTTWSPKALEAAKAFKGIKVAKPLAKQKGTKAAAIQRAVRTYYFG